MHDEWAEFCEVWEGMAADGTVDALGGVQCNRVWWEWCSQEPMTKMERFIIVHRLDTSPDLFSGGDLGGTVADASANVPPEGGV